MSCPMIEVVHRSSDLQRISLAIKSARNPCESVESASSVMVYAFGTIALLVPHRPRMTLIRRIRADIIS